MPVKVEKNTINEKLHVTRKSNKNSLKFMKRNNQTKINAYFSTIQTETEVIESINNHIGI